ncbi:MTH1187 family thiamine-binding protein [Halomonas borealis]|uniref:MTH1187 family thiamine-binding protein n=1 Tax=Halomonas borealis TaxID=2508710 RepID=UPI00109FD9DC|nr:MTH1187 family thiamine-binding protein [Halomonas borealis]
MDVIVDLCVVPMGVGVSVSPQVAACQRVIEASGLEYRMHAYGTNIEGPWDEVMAVVKRCHETVHEMGAPRITSTLKLGTRIDREQHMNDKVASVESLLGESSSSGMS